ncbi:hypothetical protein [Chelativorans sp. AA-79]|nr:hypothetical protein [Chelativorans sp. AA-79]WEX12104.1 hypothetical protein PVE73_26795 [Chelativorans sp. AA-79]
MAASRSNGLWPLILPTFLALVAITVAPILVTFGISLFYIDLATCRV